MSHVVAIAWIQKHSKPNTPVNSVCIAKTWADKMLQDSFRERGTEIGKKTFSDAEPRLLEEPFQVFSFPSDIPCMKRPPPQIFAPLEEKPSFLTAESLINELSKSGSLSTFTLPAIEPLNLFENLPKNLICPLPRFSDVKPFAPSCLSHPPAAFVSIPPKRPDISFEMSSTDFLAAKIEQPAPSAQFLQKEMPLSHFPSLAELGAYSYSDFFDTEIFFSPEENGEGYVFAITLVPQSSFNFPKFNQHYSFLIDRSNSNQKERLSIVKNSVLKAIENLEIDDSFNIITFDSKIEKLSPTALLPTSLSIQAARNFLETIHLGSFFSTANLCKPLLFTMPSFEDDGLHTAILLSDGEPLNKKIAQRELMLDWTNYNNGRVSLFTIGVKGDPNLTILETAAAFNQGKTLHAPTKRGIKRQLLKLMKAIRHPIGKNITATAIAHHPQTKISLYPKSRHMPLLYQTEPYVIMGTINHLDQFTLFVQGKGKNQWFNIKKTITFVNAKKGDVSLKTEWAQNQAFGLYEGYLVDLYPK